MTGYHMPFPAAGFVEAASGSEDAAFRWVPTSYQFLG